MRLFLNAIFHLKQAFPTILPELVRILEENNWTNERTLFHFMDINDAKSENQTTHAKMSKAFPYFAPYWKSDYDYQKYHLKPAKPHQVSFFTNFPGVQQGKVMFLPNVPNQTQIDNDMMIQVCEKIPRPYSLYSAVVMLDGINWYQEKPNPPEWDWRYTGNDYLPGTIRDIGGNAEFYQSDCVLLAKSFDQKPNLILRLELTEQHGKQQADKMVEIFSQYFGQPDKKFVYPVPTFEEKELYTTRINQMRVIYESWRQAIQKDLVGFETAKKEQVIKQIRKIPNRKTLQKRFLERNGFKRHDLCRWDDHGWYRALPHNIWLYIEFHSSAKIKVMSFECYGISFDLHENIFAENFTEEHGDVAGVIAFEKFEYILNRFIDEIVPKFVEIYQEDTDNFYQESIEHRYYKEEYRIIMR